jgi:hypothetical protein
MTEVSMNTQFLYRARLTGLTALAFVVVSHESGSSDAQQAVSKGSKFARLQIRAASQQANDAHEKLAKPSGTFADHISGRDLFSIEELPADGRRVRGQPGHNSANYSDVEFFVNGNCRYDDLAGLHESCGKAPF